MAIASPRRLATAARRASKSSSPDAAPLIDTDQRAATGVWSGAARNPRPAQRRGEQPGDDVGRDPRRPRADSGPGGARNRQARAGAPEPERRQQRIVELGVDTVALR